MKLLNLKYKMHKLVNLVFYLIIFAIGFLLGFGADKINVNKIIGQILFIDNVQAVSTTSCYQSKNLLDSDKHVLINDNRFIYNYNKDKFQFVFNSYKTDNTGTFPLGFELSLEKNTTYTLSWLHNSPNNTINKYFYIYTGGWSSNLLAYSNANEESLTFTTDSNTTYYIQYYISGRYNENDVVNLSSIMLNVGNLPLNFESYGKIICPNGDTFYNFSKNIIGDFDIENIWIYDFITFGLVATCFTLFVLVVGYIFNKFFGG